MFQITIRFADNESWFTDIAQKFDTTITILETKTRPEETGFTDLIEIQDPQNLREQLIHEIQVHPRVLEVNSATSRKGVIMCMVKTDRPGLPLLLNGSDCFRISICAIPTGEMEWKLISPGESAVRLLYKELHDQGIKPRLVSKSQITREALLTLRQERILQTAYKRGFFDYPKRVSIRELARVFQISISTISEILRKSEKKIVATYFKENSSK